MNGNMQCAILMAFARGYRVTSSGVLLSSVGSVVSIKLYGKQRYPSFSLNAFPHTKSKVFGIPVHKFAAFCFYSEDSFKPGIIIRHLNANTLDVSKTNLVLGTHSENNMDKPPSIRKWAATIARAAQGVQYIGRKLTDTEVAEIRNFYEERDGRKAPNGSITALAEKYGVCRTTIVKAGKGINYVG